MNNTGIFQDSGDVGECKIKGETLYDSTEQVYHLSGSGQNIWDTLDQFHYTWIKLDGDFIVRSRVKFVGDGSHEHRKIGWMVRNSLDTGSPHVNGVVHGDGLTSLQFRKIPGGVTEEIKSPATSPDIIQLERRANEYILSTAKFGETFTTVSTKEVHLEDSVFVGIFICSHDNEVLEQAVFSNVRIIKPAWEGLVQYRDYLGSRLEIMDVGTGHRKILFEAPNSIQAPNWAPLEDRLIYNCDGLLYSFSLESLKPEKINTGFATSNNNDHSVSFDGKMLAISNHVEEDNNNSIIFTLPVDGGTPERITEQGPSYLHGWSPDGTGLVFTGGRAGNYDIYKIDVKEKKEVRLTLEPGLDDGSEYSPDGKYIYFNSNRTGTMQIWRMDSDGMNPVQITHDEYNDWFPHISPDGKWIVFLSFMKEVDPGDHPFYRHVYLRLLPVSGEGEPRVIAYIYGGQGTINVASWSPDSRNIAFVSNSGPVDVTEHTME